LRGLPNDSPEWVRELVSGLTSFGFTLAEERLPNRGLGDCYATYQRRHFLVRPVRDRGEWRVNLTDDLANLDRAESLLADRSTWRAVHWMRDQYAKRRFEIDRSDG
jgi:hypothetical protein